MNDNPVTEVIVVIAALLFIGGCLIGLREFFGKLKNHSDQKRSLELKRLEAEREGIESRALAIRQQTQNELVRQESQALEARRQELEQIAHSESEKNMLAVKSQCVIHKFKISNGTGASRGAIVVEVQWSGSEGAILRIARSEGDVCDDLRELRESKTYRRLPFSKKPTAYNHIDREVTPGVSYSYYAYVEAYVEVALVSKKGPIGIYRQSFARPFRFLVQSIGAHKTETMIKGNERRIQEMESTLRVTRASKAFQSEMNKINGVIGSDPLAEFRQFAADHIRDGTVVDVTDQYRMYLLNEIGMTDEEEIEKLIQVFSFHKNRIDK